MDIFSCLVFSALIAEIILDSTWNPYYFRYGLTVFRKVFPLPRNGFKFPEIEILNDKFEGDLFTPSLVFGRLSERELAFRAKKFQISVVTYTPMLHAYLKYDEKDKKLTLACYPNLTASVLFIGLMWFIFPDFFKETGLLASGKNLFIDIFFVAFLGFFFFSLFGGIALYQISKFKEIVEFIIKEDSKGDFIHR